MSKVTKKQVQELLTRSEEKTPRQPSEAQLITIGKWVAVFAEHYHRELSPGGVATYIEGLKKYTPAEIERACDRTLAEVDTMPTVAHIRARVNVYEDPQTANDNRGCGDCQGTGWKIVKRPDGLGNMAVKCGCVDR